MSSETSFKNNINYLDNNGKKILSETKNEIKKQTSDTDFYFDMVANKDKIVVKTLDESESSDLQISEKYMNTSSDSSKSSKLSKSSKSSKLSKSSKSSKSSKLSNFSTKKPNVETFNFSNNTNNTNNNIPNISAIPILTTNTLPSLDPTIDPKILTPQEIRIKKIELLRRLCEIKMKGYNLTKEYDFNSSIEEMEYEYALLKSFADKRNGIKLYKSFLLNTVSLVEFANDKYDPFDFKLNGWSEHMSVEVDSWDDVLEELYEKYKTSGGSWPVELKLALLIVGSGAGYHFTKSQFSALPSGMGAGSILGKMMSDKKTSQFMTPQEVNLENQKKMMKEREMTLKQQQKDKIKETSESNTDTQQKFNFGSFFGSGSHTNTDTQNTNKNNFGSLFGSGSQANNVAPTFNKGNSRDIPEIRTPENVAEILSRIKNIQSQANINTTDTQEENSSNNDRLLSDVTLSTSDNKKRCKKSVKKPLISINT